ncbi:MAG: gamma-glutamylcyclotransferase family protein [Candidatus Thiodiazotropha sp.]
MKYFAYGSNMSFNRLRSRTPSAHRIGVFELPGYKLKFHKIGKDGSAKCNAYFTGIETDIVEGLAFEIDPCEIKTLDKVEDLGKGYEKKNVIVTNNQGVKLEVFSYFATNINDSLLPFSWYKKHVLEGAESAGLSDKYISEIMDIKAINDPDSLRESRELKIYE